MSKFYGGNSMLIGHTERIYAWPDFMVIRLDTGFGLMLAKNKDDGRIMKFSSAVVSSKKCNDWELLLVKFNRRD